MKTLCYIVFSIFIFGCSAKTIVKKETLTIDVPRIKESIISTIDLPKSDIPNIEVYKMLNSLPKDIYIEAVKLDNKKDTIAYVRTYIKPDSLGKFRTDIDIRPPKIDTSIADTIQVYKEKTWYENVLIYFGVVALIAFVIYIKFRRRKDGI
uniref:Lipoprotein n=1 Tax=viral metagenome TaxID=1070528 RepID=A0A6H2A2Z1_9ZZZZ